MKSPTRPQPDHSERPGILVQNEPADVPTSTDQSLMPSAEPSRKFQDEAFSYVSQWCTASSEFVNRKVERWKLLEDLYHNRRDLNSWAARQGSVSAENRTSLRRSAGSGHDRWQADIILSPSYIVDAWADRAYQAIFGGPDWLTVMPEHAAGVSEEDFQYPASYKLQELLLSKLAQGHIHVRLYEILQHLVLFGTVFAKVFWYSKDATRYRWDYETLEVIEEEDKVYDCPIVQVIPLDRILVDWTATHSDVQRHSGIGHRVDKTYEHVLEQFDRGVYNLNRVAFEDRWKDAPEAGADEGELLQDEDARTIETDTVKRLTVWEWHGRIPTEKGHKECLCTIVTERGSSNPKEGIMVRLLEAPVLWCGLRPFLAAHYTPLPGCFGMGAVESNLDLIHSISQFISQSQDNARLTANAQIIVRRGSSAARQISAEQDVVYPGKVWTVDDPADIMPFPPLNFPQHEVNNLINYLYGLLEKRTAVTEITLGVSGQTKTATEAHILQESGLSPFMTRTDLFSRSFLEPLGRLALAMLQQFLLDDQYIVVRDAAGRDVPLRVNASELQSGKYRVVATITRQESTRLAKAQSIERALPTLAQFQPVLAQEGVQISFSELLKRYLDLIGVDGADRVISRVDATQAEQLAQEGSPLPQGGLIGLNQRPGDLRSAEGPSRLVEKGGPMGPQPTDANALAQLLQIQAQQAVGGAP
ncbi:MAG: portal protein [Thermodesulfobacteriota bacterium]